MIYKCCEGFLGSSCIVGLSFVEVQSRTTSSTFASTWLQRKHPKNKADTWHNNIFFSPDFPCCVSVTFQSYAILFLTTMLALAPWLLMLLCPSDEASGPLLGRCVSLLYWCEDRPLGPAAFCSPESNKSMACCSLYCTQHSCTANTLPSHAHVRLTVDTHKRRRQGNFAALCSTLQVERSHTNESIRIFF